MRSYDWILSVLEDVRTFAKNEGLDELATAVDSAKGKAAEEFSKVSRAKPDKVAQSRAELTSGSKMFRAYR